MFSDIFFTLFHDFLLSVTEKRASPHDVEVNDFTCGFTCNFTCENSLLVAQVITCDHK